MSKTFLQIKDGIITNRIIADEQPKDHDGCTYHNPASHADNFHIGEKIAPELILERALNDAKSTLIKSFENDLTREMQIDFDEIAPNAFKDGTVVVKLAKLANALDYPNGDEAMLHIGQHEFISKPLKELRGKPALLSKKYYELVKKLGKLKKDVDQSTNIEALSKIVWLVLCFFLALQPALSQDTGFYVRPGSANYPSNPSPNAVAVLDSTTGYLYIYTGGSWSLVNKATFTQNNYTATADPTTGNDSTQGYSVGSVWLNVTSGEYFICQSNAATVAVWYFFANADSRVNNFHATTAPTASNDNSQGYGIGSIWANTTTGVFYSCSNAGTGVAVWNFLSNPTFNPSQLLTYTSEADVMGNVVGANLVQSVPSSSGTLSFPASFAYISGVRAAVASSTYTYAATEWTFDFIEPDGSFHHIGQPYSTLAPSDPGVLFQKVVTDGSAHITAITGYNQISQNLAGFLQPIPSSFGVFCADPGLPGGLGYELVPLAGINTSALSAGPITLRGGSIVTSSIQIPSEVTITSGASNGIFQNNSGILSFGTVTLSQLAQSGATTGQSANWNGTVWAPTSPAISIPQSAATGTTTVTLTGTSATVQSLNATGGSITANLPAISAIPLGKMFVIDNSATAGINTVTVVLSGTDTITGTNNLILTFGQVLGLVCDGVNWVCFVSK